MTEEQEIGWWVVVMGGRMRVEWGGKKNPFHSSPEGPRYVEAAGRGEQVNWNAEIIAYACSDLYNKLQLEEK